MRNEYQTLEIFIALLSFAVLEGLVTRRFRLPYTVGLVLMGLALGELNRPGMIIFPEFLSGLVSAVLSQVTPGLILGLLVTPLIFEAAFHLDWEELQHDLVTILALAVPGVILTTLLVGTIVTAGTSYPFSAALVFGALIAATDPVSVVALFRTLGVPKRLQVLLEGESLFNDGTAVVIFSLVLALAQGASVPAGGLGWLKTLADFVRVAGGGLLVGLFLGWLVSLLISRIDDHLIETSLMAVLAYGAFLAAERLEVSGVLAVVAAGLTSGHVGPRGMSPTTHIVVSTFWETAAFLSNSLVFLIIGLEMNLGELGVIWQPIILAILAVLAARVVTVYGLSWVGHSIPLRWKHVLMWGGLRGAISLALAISLPQQIGSELGAPLRSMAFGVVLFTILVQGFTMRPLARSMGLVQRSEVKEEYERRHARAVAARASLERIRRMYQQGLFSHHTWEMVAPLLEEHAQALSGAVKEVLQAEPSVEAEEMDTVRREALRAQRSALLRLLTGGVISEEIYSQLAGEVDMALSDNPNNQAGWNRSNRPPVQRLMTAVVQIQDVENAIHNLNKAGLFVTRLPSTGGFLGRRNVTLLIGVGKEQVKTAVDVLARSCRRRVEYIATPLEGAPFHMPLSTPVTVGGATIFTFKVERYEEI